MTTSRYKFVGFYDSDKPLYEFTNFGAGFSRNRYNIQAPNSEIAFQAAKIAYITDPAIRNNLWQKYLANVKSAREAFDFMQTPMAELGGKTINDVIEASAWHQPVKHGSQILCKDIEMAHCLVSKFDPNKNPKLFQQLISTARPETILIETSPHDSYWGFAKNKKDGSNGKNRLGLMLTALARAAQENKNFDSLSHDQKVQEMLFHYELFANEAEKRNVDFMALPLENLKSKTPHRFDRKGSSTHATNSMFKHAKPRPDSKEVLEASDNIADSIRYNAATLQNEDFLIRKGNIKGTFKIAFKNDDAAKEFMEHLKALGFNQNISYYGDKKGKNAEKYPMDENGFVNPKGKYKNIVRFEVSDEGLEYLKSIGAKNPEALFKQIMGSAPKHSKKH